MSTFAIFYGYGESPALRIGGASYNFQDDGTGHQNPLYVTVNASYFSQVTRENFSVMFTQGLTEGALYDEYKYDDGVTTFVITRADLLQSFGTLMPLLWDSVNELLTNTPAGVTDVPIFKFVAAQDSGILKLATDSAGYLFVDGDQNLICRPQP